jgi:hypothetical protein
VIRRPAKYTAHFRIGVVNLTFRTSMRSVLNDYAAIYDHCRVAAPAADSIVIEAFRQPFQWRHRRRVDVSVNGHVQFQPLRTNHVLPCIEWCVNWAMPSVLSRYLQLHAASMVYGDVGVIFPGVSGAGKSTLAAGLLSRGWGYLCDEFALADCDSLTLHPYSRALCIKEPSFPVIRSLGLSLERGRYYVKGTKGYVGYINPTRVRDDAVASPVPVQYIILPTYEAGAQPSLTPMHRAEAAFTLHQMCFNLTTCRRAPTEVITRLVRRAECYRLVSGDIHQTCALVESLVGQSVAGLARSA